MQDDQGRQVARIFTSYFIIKGFSFHMQLIKMQMTMMGEKQT